MPHREDELTEEQKRIQQRARANTFANQRVAAQRRQQDPTLEGGNNIFSTQPISSTDVVQLPGESGRDFFLRKQRQEEEAERIQEEARRQEKILRGSIEEQRGIQQDRLRELAELLAQEEERKFGQAIPEIAETAQAQGFLETSGFGDALAEERAKLAGRSQFELARQGLRDRNLEVSRIGDISRRVAGFGTSGLERSFDVADRTRQEVLARELGEMGVPTQQQSSGGSAFGPLQGLGSGAAIGGAFGPVGAAIGGGIGLAGGAANEETYLCTHLVQLGLMTEEEKKKVHDKIFPYAFLHPIDLIVYGIEAPQFIRNNASINWKSLKPLLCDDIINSSSQKEAFEKYKTVCTNLFFRPKFVTKEI